MNLDINLFRTEKDGNRNTVRESIKKRYQDPRIVDDVIALDEHWRKKRFLTDQCRKKLGSLSKAISSKKKQNRNDPCTEEIAAYKEINDLLSQDEEETEDIRDDIIKLVNKIGNIVHESVPVDNDEANHHVIRNWGIPPDIKITELPGKPGQARHHEILAMIDGIEQKRGIKVAGEGGYYLKGYGALLNMALYVYGINFLVRRGYTFMQPPLTINGNIMAEIVQQSELEEYMYDVIFYEWSGYEDKTCLISAAEQPLLALYKNEWLDLDQLPIKLASVSTCFRKEAEDKESLGVFRTRQFEVVQQLCIADPEKSWEIHEDMLKVSEEFYQSLKLPYRIVNVASGVLGRSSSKTYNLEAWFPGYGSYKELVSCSNYTDYLSRVLEIRYGNKKSSDKEKKYVHMLSSTLCVTQRTLSCILENYQTETGVKVPDVLVPFVGTNFIPYVEPIVEQQASSVIEPEFEEKKE